MNEPRIYTQPLHKLESFIGRSRRKPLDVRPRFLWIDEVRRQWRNSTPIIYSRSQKKRILLVRQVRWRLHIHFTEQQSGGGDCSSVINLAGLGMVAHWNLGLCPEVLNDDLLNMSVALVKIANRN